MYKIDVANNQEYLTIDEEVVRSVVRQTLDVEQVAAATISLAIVDNEQIRELNRQYLNHDYETDVLSFPLDESAETSAHQSDDAPRGAGKSIDGEIIVSAEMAIELAADYSWDVSDELTLYIVHGLLHLCGYDDLTEAELPIMRARECHVFKALGRPRPMRDAADRGHVDDRPLGNEVVVPESGVQS